MAGMPGMFVALVPSGAHVMTVTGSLEPPGSPGSTPHPVTTDTPAATVHKARTTGFRRKSRGKDERCCLPVMYPHTSGLWVTARWGLFNRT
ncbi:hypothetical protein GCM10011583_51730 [Streptomyces camponoticapitis]|uniref:Secreted protein n=1 Tax=Streptomyces camponoticapitis TaxID=1616125 RepID=A0ABQ2EMT2_9ACTN|nr:hypothetical protein GCM10011583_51730 [Streptomyces camponoticapitis]